MSVDADRAIAFLDQFPAKAHARILKVMTRIGLDLQGYIQINKLQGQVLNHRSGKLSANVKANTTDGAQITTTVGVNSTTVPYAAIHEYGFTGTEQVRAHARTITMVFGKAINPTTINVAAFSRKMNMPERSYLRSGLADRQQSYIDQLRSAVGASNSN